MKILFIIPNLFRGGAEYQLVELCRSLQAHPGLEVRVLSYYSEQAADLPGHYEELRTLGIPVDTLFDRFVTGWPLLLAARRYISSHPSHVIQAFLQANLYTGLCALGLPGNVFYGIRSMIHLNSLEQVLYRLLDFRICGYVGNAQHVTNHFCDQLRCTDDKRITIYNGIDTARFAYLKPRIETRADLGIPQDSRCLITVANMHHMQKGHGDLMKAWIILSRARPQDHLLLVGTGSLLESLRQEAGAAGLASRTHFLGMRTDVVDLLAACDLYVSPSWVEGFSNSIAEAILCNLPVVATEVGGTPEFVKEGAHGALVVARQPEALAAAMNRDYLPRTPSDVKAFANSISITRLGSEYVELYHQALSKSIQS